MLLHGSERVNVFFNEMRHCSNTSYTKESKSGIIYITNASFTGIMMCTLFLKGILTVIVTSYSPAYNEK